MNAKTIERALTRYADTKDEDVRTRLKLFGPLMLEAARVANTLDEDDVHVKAQASDEEILAAAKGGATLLSKGPIEINGESFERDLKALGATLIESLAALGGDETLLAEARAFNWAPFVDEAWLVAAACDPMKGLAVAETLTAGTDERLVDMWLLPVLGETLRAYLDAFANRASNRLADIEGSAPSWDRRMTCFVCGADPDMAFVAATTKNGNVKRLHCGACGATWSFERIRCARCGDEAVSDLSYIADADDNNMRLHICAACGAAMPTHFAPGDEETCCPEVDAVVLTGLEEAYAEALERGTVPGKVLKQGDATLAGRGPGKGMV